MKTILEYLYNRKGAIKQPGCYIIMPCDEDFRFLQQNYSEYMIKHSYFQVYVFLFPNNMMKNILKSLNAKLTTIFKYDGNINDIKDIKNILSSSDDLKINNLLNKSTAYDLDEIKKIIF